MGIFGGAITSTTKNAGRSVEYGVKAVYHSGGIVGKVVKGAIKGTGGLLIGLARISKISAKVAAAVALNVVGAPLSLIGNAISGFGKITAKTGGAMLHSNLASLH